MAEKYQSKYRIPPARWQNWDYGSNGAYFITICTKNYLYYFGEISNTNMKLNEIGKLAVQYWLEIRAHFSFVELGAFVVMPNHVHGILIINKPPTVETGHWPVSVDVNAYTSKSIGQMRFRNQGSHTISSIVGAYKSVVTKQARLVQPDFGWQRLFYDIVIRDEESFEAIQNYIVNNPANWKKDKFFMDNT
jgi:putative transposase